MIQSLVQRASLSSYRKLSCVKYGLLLWLARTLLRLKVSEIDLHWQNILACNNKTYY